MPQHKASYLTVQCKQCRATQVVPCKPGLGGALLPRRCETRDPINDKQCPPDSWVVLGERSRYVDQQTLKLQVGTKGCSMKLLGNLLTSLWHVPVSLQDWLPGLACTGDGQLPAPEADSLQKLNTNAGVHETQR